MKKILLACQHLDFKLIEKILRSDCVVRNVQSCTEMFTYAKKKECDLMLIDVDFLKSDYNTIQSFASIITPIVVLTAEPSDVQNKELNRHGLTLSFFVKPILYHDFIHFIRKTLRR